MKNNKTDFTYNAGDWRVYNFTAISFEGRIQLELTGRAKDDWIGIRGQIENMNVGTLFLLSSRFKRAPVTGRLDLSADLWADTNTDFFATLAGTASVKLRDGNLDKFPLLSRLLELIDLRSWITAQLPDPRVSGVRFRTVTADFKGQRGVFYTDNLKMDGPVMDILASGDVNAGKATLRMTIVMIPFSTVTWLMSSIPIVGANMAGGTKSIISAYFNATGPIANPTVTAAPITSAAELLKKTVGLPINLIRPDTIK